MTRDANRTTRVGVLLVAVTAVLLVMAACGGEVSVEDARQGFIAEMGSFSAQPVDPMEGDGAADAMEDGAGDGEASAMEGDGEEAEMGAEEAMMGPTPHNVLLDFLLHNEGEGALDGVTVDLTIADADGTEKGRHLIWVDTTGWVKGQQQQIAHELMGVEYVEGDGFHVEVRHPIPMEERGDYREFAAEN